MTIRKSIHAAAQVPAVPFWAQLVAQIPMNGGKVVPKDLWGGLAKALEKGYQQDAEVALEELQGSPHTLSLNEKVEKIGFIVKSNHARGEAHDVWICRVLDEFRKSPRTTVWAIPVDELLCMYHNDEEWCDLVEITRFFFVGSEKKMRSAVKKLIANIS